MKLLTNNVASKASNNIYMLMLTTFSNDVTMCNLSKQEEEILKMRLTSADDKIVAFNLHISESQVRVIKARVRSKRKKAKSLLEATRKYDSILYPKRKGE